MPTAHDEVELRSALLPGDATEQPGISFRGKHTEVFIGALTLLAVSFTAAAIYGSFLATSAYRKIAFPHKAVHATEAQAKDGLDVVRPYFAPAARGGISDIYLSITVWFRPGEPLPTFSSLSEDEPRWWRADEAEESHRMTGELGYVPAESGVHPPWELVWSGNLSGLTDIEGSSRDTIQLVLPGRIIKSLVSERSSLVTLFELKPAADNFGTVTEHSSTRPVTMYGKDKGWPLPSAEDDSTNPWSTFLAHSSAGTSLVERERFYYGSDDDAIVLDSSQKFAYATWLAHGTLVTFASDYSVYRRADFVAGMDALRGFKEECAKVTRRRKDCLREFSRDGHLENLAIIDGGQSGKQWKYGPFLTTRLTPRTAASYESISGHGRSHSTGFQDHHFHWTVTYGALSPTKLSLFKYQDWAWLFNTNSSEAAQNHDQRELYMSFFGLNLNPNSRPILRGALGLLVRALQMLNVPYVLVYAPPAYASLVALYWVTRHTFAGLPISVLTLETLSDLVYSIVTRSVGKYRPWEDMATLAFGLTAATYTALIVKQLHLRYRPEFRFTEIGRTTVRAPTAVRFGRPSATEKNSLHLVSKFDWRLRLAICVVAVLCFRFSSWPPPIIDGGRYEDMIYGSHTAQHWHPKALSILHLLDVIQSSVWLVARLSQIHLNHRTKTFAGSYRLSTYVLFGAELLSGLVKVFGPWLGRAKFLRPFTLWNCVSLLIYFTLVGQAVRLPSVQQRTEEERED